MSEHSSIMGGSNADRRILCPGSYELEKPFAGLDTSSDYADQGSVLHEAMKDILDNGDFDGAIDKDVMAFIKGLVGKHYQYRKEFAITQELINLKVLPALQELAILIDEYDIEEWVVEAKVSLDSVVPGAHGTVDFLGKDAHLNLHTLDWKFGDGISVSAVESYQLGFYTGCALYDEQEIIKEMCAQLGDKVYFHIVQSREDFDIRSTWETDIDWIEDLVDLAAASLGKNDIVPGSHCRWCKAQPTCPAHKDTAISALKTEIRAVSAVELSKLLDMADQLKPWISKVYELAQNEAEAGVQIPGRKLVEKRAVRKWGDEAAAEKAMKGSRFKIDEMYTRKLISPTQAEKLSKKVYDKKLVEFVTKQSSGLTLALTSDKREAVVDQFNLLDNAMAKAGHIVKEA